MRTLCVVLGDQLNADAAIYDGFDPALDAVWMAEVREEATHVWSHPARIALFLAAMRAYAQARLDAGCRVVYRRFDAPDALPDLGTALATDLATLRPQRVVWVWPGDWRVAQQLIEVVEHAGVPYSVLPDRHFYATPDDFATWAAGRRELRLEYWYRFLRQRHAVLMDGGQPAGGRWNYDADNRAGFDRQGPPLHPAPRRFLPDVGTQAVLTAVAVHYPDHPGSLEHFDWPVNPAQARLALADFIEHRLPLFGRYQDAMWTGEPWLFHSRLSAALNLKLIDPRVVVDAAVAAWQSGHAPLAAVEGFVRQILGWREYVRGLYWHRMPGYLQLNALGAEQPLPAFYWTAETDYRCLREAIGQTLQHGYAHHIQRLMVTGVFGLLLGVSPQALHAWYLAVYVDAVEWVELPNTLGMSQYADGGIMASKPYVASGRYIQRMSNYCQGCRYRPDQSVGPQACPFTTLFWDFLERHQDRFARHPRTAQMWRNLQRLSPETRAAIAAQAKALRAQLAAVPSG